MNKDRRKQIADALAKIEAAKEEFASMIEGAKEELESARDDEQEYLDNMPESLQQGEKGGAASEAIDALETLLSALDDPFSEIDTDEVRSAVEG